MRDQIKFTATSPLQYLVHGTVYIFVNIFCPACRNASHSSCHGGIPVGIAVAQKIERISIVLLNGQVIHQPEAGIRLKDN